MRVDVPVLYTPTPTPPLVAPECPEDPIQGFTEYKGTFQVQRPHDLAAKDRMKYENGIYTFWVNSGDKAHQPGNTTAPRTEARYPNFNSGEHMWSADVMFETVSKTCIMQIHNVNPAIAMYMRVQGDRMFNLSTGKTFLTNYNNKWFNLKVALNTRTRQVRIFINNCLKETSQAPSSGTPGLVLQERHVHLRQRHLPGELQEPASVQEGVRSGARDRPVPGPASADRCSA